LAAVVDLSAAADLLAAAVVDLSAAADLLAAR
jgi:hypothetical protein